MSQVAYHYTNPNSYSFPEALHNTPEEFRVA